MGRFRGKVATLFTHLAYRSVLHCDFCSDGDAKCLQQAKFAPKHTFEPYRHVRVFGARHVTLILPPQPPISDDHFPGILHVRLLNSSILT